MKLKPCVIRVIEKLFDKRYLTPARINRKNNTIEVSKKHFENNLTWEQIRIIYADHFMPKSI